MNARKALTYLDGFTSIDNKTFDEVRATLDQCVEACESAEQTLRNLATGSLTGDSAEIAHNAAGILYNALKGEK